MDSQKTVKDKMTAYLKDAVRAVQVENVNKVEAVGSQETTNAVCYAMEAIFLHGLKGSNTNKHFWPLVKKFTHKATLSQITELSQISTDVGRCRAWIRIAINDSAMDSYTKVIMDDTATVRHYYESSAYFRDIEQCNAMQTHLQGLVNFAFELAFNSTVLNQWTTATLVLSGLTISDHLDWPVATTAGESFSRKGALEVSFQHQLFHSPIPVEHSSTLPKSSSYPHDLSDGYDSCFQLSQSEIDTIRSMSSALRACSETPVSMLSKPDFTENHPTIYNQPVSAITSDSDQDSIDPERTDEQRDLRFERIVRTNLERYPLDFDHNQSSLPEASGLGKVPNATTGNDKGTREINEVTGTLKYKSSEECKSTKFAPCNLGNENNTKVTSNNPFDEDNFGIGDCDLSNDQNRPQLVNISTFGKGESQGTGCSSSSEKLTTDEDRIMADGKLFKKSGLVRKNCIKSKQLKKGMSSKQEGAGAAHTFEDTDKIWKVEEESGASSGLENDLHASEDMFDDIYLPRRTREESFNSMLKTYMPAVSQVKIRTLDSIIDALPRIEDSGETFQDDMSSSGWASSDMTDTYENSSEEKVNQQAEFLYKISTEKGLSQQCYQCRNCARAIGMFYDQDRVCAFDGYHYCNECHENKEHWIPAKVVYNWDFRQYKVSNLSYEYIQKGLETPLLDIEKLNIKLYSHVKLLDAILTLRTQLRFIKSYMMTCTQAVALEFMEKFDSQPYLFENIHLYSLKDLTLVPSGTLQKRLQKIVKYATSHVYSCPRCCQKGFYCEICRVPKVIYPFETSSTFRCHDCKAVYHSQCKTHLVPCPKCKRLSERETSLQKSLNDPIDSVDYSYRSENGLSQT